MKVTLERLPESRVQLDIEVDGDRLERSLDAAYRRLAARSRIPGFRPGKAPRHIVERHFGRSGLIREAMEKLVPDVYNEAIEAEAVDAIAQPDLEIVDLEPVRFKAVVAVRPTVELGDYRSIRVEPEEITVSEEAVAEQMLMLRRRHATIAPVDRPAAWDDFLTADISGTLEGEPFVEDNDAEFPLREGRTLFLPGLAELFLGMSKGEVKAVELPVPEDFAVERARGKSVALRLEVKEVKEEQLPDEDDELAAMVNADEFSTLEALKERIRADMEKSLREEAEGRLRQDAIAKMVEMATLEYPRVVVEREIDNMVRDAMGNSRESYASHLAHIGRTEAEFRETLREAAEARVRRSLVLVEMAEKEGIDVSAEQVEEEVESLAAPMGDDAARFRELFASNAGLGTIYRNLLTRATLERISLIARGEAPPLPPAAEEVQAAEDAAPAAEAEEPQEAPAE